MVVVDSSVSAFQLGSGIRMNLFESLPYELVSIILNLNWTGKVVGRFVCKYWKELMPPPVSLQSLPLDSQEFRETLCLLANPEFNTTVSEVESLLAESYSYPNLIRWLQSLGCSFTPKSQSYISRCGDLSLIRSLNAPEQECLTHAAETGNIELVKELAPLWCLSTFEAALKGRQLSVLQFMRDCIRPVVIGGTEEGPRKKRIVLSGLRTKTLREIWNGGVFLSAVRAEAVSEPTGSFPILEWLLAEKCPWTPCAFNTAANAGRVDLLNWLEKLGRVPEENYLLRSAVASGSADTIDWLLARGFQLDEDSAMDAVFHEHLHLLSRLPEMTASMVDDCLEDLVDSSQLNSIKFLLDRGLIDTDSVQYTALRGRNLDVIAWLNTIVGIDTQLYLDHAREFMDHRLLRYLCREHLVSDIIEQYRDEDFHTCQVLTILAESYPEIKLDAKFLSMAIRDDRTEVAELLMTRGIVLNADCMLSASTGGGDAIRRIKLLRQYDCPWHPDVCNNMLRFDIKGIEEVLRLGCPWKYTLDQWQRGSRAIIKESLLLGSTDTKTGF